MKAKAVLVFEPNSIDSMKMAAMQLRALLADLQQQASQLTDAPPTDHAIDGEEPSGTSMLNRKIKVIEQLLSEIERELIDSVFDLNS